MFGAYNAGPAEDNDGWGVDPTMYTTKLDRSSFTAEQLKRADDIAKQILEERAGRRVPTSFNESATASPMMPRAMAQDVMNISSAEDAMRLLGQQKARQTTRVPQHQPLNGGIQRRPVGGRAPQRQPAPIGRQQRQPIGQPRGPQRTGRPASAPIGRPAPAPAPSTVSKASEEAAYEHLKKELLRVRMLLSTFGEPNNAQKGKFLRALTTGLVACLKQPPPDVRSTVGEYFRRTGWEIRHNKPVPGVKPPTGEHMETLLRFSVTFFGKRIGKPTATEIIAASQPRAEPVQRQQPRAPHPPSQRQQFNRAPRPQQTRSNNYNNGGRQQRQWKPQQRRVNSNLNQPRRR